MKTVTLWGGAPLVSSAVMVLCCASGLSAQQRQEVDTERRLIELPPLLGTYTWQRTQKFQDITPQEHLDACRDARIAMQRAGSEMSRVADFIARLSDASQWVWHHSLTDVGRCVAKLVLATSPDEQSFTEIVYDENNALNRWQMCYHDKEMLLVRRGCDKRSDIVSISNFAEAASLEGDLRAIWDKIMEVNAMMVNGKRTEMPGGVVAWVYQHGGPMAPRGPAHKVRLAPFFLEVGERMVMTRSERDDSVVFELTQHAIGGSPLMVLRVHLEKGLYRGSTEKYFLPFSPVVRMTESVELQYNAQARIMRPEALLSALDGPPSVGMDYREDGSPRQFDPRKGLPYSGRGDPSDRVVVDAAQGDLSGPERVASREVGVQWKWAAVVGVLGVLSVTWLYVWKRRTA